MYGFRYDNTIYVVEFSLKTTEDAKRLIDGIYYSGYADSMCDEVTVDLQQRTIKGFDKSWGGEKS